MRNFLIQLILVACGASLAYFLLGYVMPQRFFFDSYLWIALLFFMVTYSFHIGLKKNYHKGSKEFVRYYMGATGAKLFFFLILIIVYGMLNKAEAISYALAFFYFYIIFTVFEVSVALKQFGNKTSAEKQV